MRQTQPAEDRYDPAHVVHAVGDVAGDGDEIRLPVGEAIHDETKIIAIRRALQMKIARCKIVNPSQAAGRRGRRRVRSTNST